jgi:hypothetical protein
LGGLSAGVGVFRQAAGQRRHSNAATYLVGPVASRRLGMCRAASQWGKVLGCPYWMVSDAGGGGCFGCGGCSEVESSVYILSKMIVRWTRLALGSCVWHLGRESGIGRSPQKAALLIETRSNTAVLLPVPRKGSTISC